MDKKAIFEKVKEIIEKHDPLKLSRGGKFNGQYDTDAEVIALFMADKSNIVNHVTIPKRVHFVFKNAFTKETAVDGPYILKRISDEIFEKVKV